MIDKYIISSLRGIPIEAILLNEKAVRDKRDKRKWITAVGVISITGQKFKNWNIGKGGYGAIDMVIHLRQVNFLAACKILLDEQHDTVQKCLLSNNQILQKKKLILPIRDDSKYVNMLRYLCVTRKIPPIHVFDAVEKQMLYADKHSNAVFLLLGKRNIPVGAELRGTSSQVWRGMATGSSKSQGFFYAGNKNARIAILCEAAIDVLSCLAFYPGTQCISTAGASSYPPWLPLLLASKEKVYCGYDNDKTGQNMYRKMSCIFPGIRRLTPTHKDWNDDLCAS